MLIFRALFIVREFAVIPKYIRPYPVFIRIGIEWLPRAFVRRIRVPNVPSIVELMSPDIEV